MVQPLSALARISISALAAGCGGRLRLGLVSAFNAHVLFPPDNTVSFATGCRRGLAKAVIENCVETATYRLGVH